jgi:hypothetical protein
MGESDKKRFDGMKYIKELDLDKSAWKMTIHVS